MMENTEQSATLSRNSIALIALCNEYCAALEQVARASRSEFTGEMLRLLPRIYISATDLVRETEGAESDMFVSQVLEEDQYDSVRTAVERVMGGADTYLEVFEEDMKYSDTPIAASVSEGLADLYQVFYNMLATVREAPSQLVAEVLLTVGTEFGEYWSQTLCNVLRALNQVRYGESEEEI